MSGKQEQKINQDEIKQQLEEQKKKEYQKRVKQSSPKPNCLSNAFKAFIVGGGICVIAQIITMSFQKFGFVEKEAATATLIIMIFFGAFLTGLGVYDSLAKFAGAGSLIPITGFANSIVSPAMEFKKEGFVYGVGSRMFIIAGPVLVYGFLISVFIGLITFVLL